MLIGIANSIGSGSIATRGPELITNGNFSELGSELFLDSNFDNGLDDWAINPSNSWTVNNDSVIQSLVSPVYNNNVVYQNILTSGNYYKTEWHLFSMQSNTSVHIASSNSADYFNISNAEDSAVFLSTGTYLGLRVKRISGYSVMYLESLSVKQTNPNLSSQWNIPSGWDVSDRLIGTNVTGEAKQSITALEVGATYEVSFEIFTRTSGSVRFRVSKPDGTLATSGTARSATGVYTQQFTNNYSGVTVFKMDGVTAFSGTIGKISLKKVLF